jgi:hypothetical protein
MDVKAINILNSNTFASVPESTTATKKLLSTLAIILRVGFYDPAFEVFSPRPYRSGDDATS